MEGTMSSIMGWGPTWAPRTWAFCAGQLLAISSNTALFSLIGTIYGGDGRTTFALPDLRGRVPIAAGQSPGTSFYPQGAKVGSDTQTLTQLEMPVHNHSASTVGLNAQMPVSSSNGTGHVPGSNQVLASAVLPTFGDAPANIYADSGNANTTLATGTVTGNVTIGNAGGSQPFSIVQPLLAIQFIICVQGLFPSRN